MKIAETAEATGLSADTIRYYERAGLLSPIPRSRDGHRNFGEAELRWLRLYDKLRSTGMPLAEMKRYAALARQGDDTLAARRLMLERHGERLVAQQQKIDACRDLIGEKITLYRRREAGQGEE